MKFVSLVALLLMCVSCANGGWNQPHNNWGAQNAAQNAGQAAAAHIHHHTPAPAPAPGGF